MSFASAVAEIKGIGVKVGSSWIAATVSMSFLIFKPSSIKNEDFKRLQNNVKTAEPYTFHSLEDTIIFNELK